VRLPAEYAEWMELSQVPRVAASVAETVAAGARPAEGFRIVSPGEGDVYRLPPGVVRRYATVALRAAGGRAGTTVRWIVDGAPYKQGRWTLQEGRHRFRAISAESDTAEVAVTVE
jgi:hypothetical protein